MDNATIQKKCEEFLASLGIPGYIFFAWEKGTESQPQAEDAKAADKKDYGFVYAARQFPPQVAMKGLVWAMDQMVGQTPSK